MCYVAAVTDLTVSLLYIQIFFFLSLKYSIQFGSIIINVNLMLYDAYSGKEEIRSYEGPS